MASRAPSDSSSARIDERLQELVRRRAADASSPEGGGLHDAERLEVAQRLPDGRLARPELPGDPGLDDPGARRVATVKDRLEQAILDLVAQDAARDRGIARHGGDGQSFIPTGAAVGAAARISTTPVVPLMRIRSPFLICSVATDVPTTAGMPNSRDEDGRVRHRPARVGHEADDLGEEDDPGRVRHLADEDVARPDVVELVLAEDDAGDALDDARRGADAR